MNDFGELLEYSLEESENKIFDLFYFRVFPTLDKIEVVTDLATQKEGIDKRLYFKNNRTLNVDEKKRRKDYGDILIEEYSDYDKKIVGWLGNQKKTDYIAYAIMPAKKIYLLPFLLLQKAVRANYYKWVDLYGRKFAPNRTYRTSNIPVPTTVLLEAIKDAMVEAIA